jgi:hypothetical protein
MQSGWESEIGGSRSRIEMVGSEFLSRPRPCMGCSVWGDDDNDDDITDYTDFTF